MNQDIEDFNILREYYLDDLEKEIKVNLKEGFCPYGNIFKEGEFICLMMVKYKPLFRYGTLPVQDNKAYIVPCAHKENENIEVDSQVADAILQCFE